MDCEIGHTGGTFSESNIEQNHLELIVAFELCDEEKLAECLLYDSECIAHFQRARTLLALDTVKAPARRNSYRGPHQ